MINASKEWSVSTRKASGTGMSAIRPRHPLHICLLSLWFFILPQTILGLPGADTLKQWLATGAPADFILIDLREASEINLSNVIGTDSCRPYLLPWNSGICSSGVSQHIPQTMSIVVYCKSGNRASVATTWLMNHGFSRVINAGGFSDWTGPAKPPTWGRDHADLPQPSMKAVGTEVLTESWGIHPEKKAIGTAVVRYRSQRAESQPAFLLSGRRVGVMSAPGFKASPAYKSVARSLGRLRYY